MRLSSEDPSTNAEVAEFFETELISTLLSNSPSPMLEEVGELLVTFLLQITLLLESTMAEVLRLQPIELCDFLYYCLLQGFPENSLHFAGTLRRAVRLMVADARTPDQHVSGGIENV